MYDSRIMGAHEGMYWRRATDGGSGRKATERLRMDRLTEDAINMLEVMDRTADRADIWQDRCVYAMAKAIYHIILHIHVEESKHGKN